MFYLYLRLSSSKEINQFISTILCIFSLSTIVWNDATLVKFQFWKVTLCVHFILRTFALSKLFILEYSNYIRCLSTIAKKKTFQLKVLETRLFFVVLQNEERILCIRIRKLVIDSLSWFYLIFETQIGKRMVISIVSIIPVINQIATIPHSIEITLIMDL